MSAKIHPSAVVDSHAQLADDVEVGPYCVVGPDVSIGAGTRLISHVSITGYTTVGEGNLFYPFSVIGSEPQDVSYAHTKTQTLIGDHNTFREHVTVHRATEKEDGVTRVGSKNYMMVGVHVAHDCKVGSNIWLANGTQLSGHVTVEDNAALSGMVGVHHFCTIGSYCFVGGCSKITSDAPPYMLVDGNPSEVRSVNLVGLRRRGFSSAEIRSLMEAHRLLFRELIGVHDAREHLVAAGALNEHTERLIQSLERKREGRVGRSREHRRAA